jgi:E3 ubiquitin-protein ligase RBBP6
MSVRFKFKNDIEYSAIPCDGFHISVHDLKRAIIRAKRLGRVTDFDLDVTNHQDGKVFENDETLIPKNSTLIIVRKPLPKGQQKMWEEEKLVSATSTGPGSGVNFGQDDDLSEADKLTNMMSNSTEMYDQKNWVRYRGKANYGGGPPPANYRCSRCHQAGHWNSDCQLSRSGGYSGQGVEVKKTTGIPRSFLKPADKNTPGAKVNPQG